MSGRRLSGPGSPEQNLRRLFPSCSLTSATAVATEAQGHSYETIPGQHLPKPKTPRSSPSWYPPGLTCCHLPAINEGLGS